MPSLPKVIKQSIAKSYHKTFDKKAVILSNIACANLAITVNLSQQSILANQQLFNQINLVITARIMNSITNLKPKRNVISSKMDAKYNNQVLSDSIEVLQAIKDKPK
ncbi:MAG: hypothetical protein HEQ35_26330 [Gloeotrichia echinulata IR180]